MANARRRWDPVDVMWHASSVASQRKAGAPLDEQEYKEPPPHKPGTRVVARVVLRHVQKTLECTCDTCPVVVGRTTQEKQEARRKRPLQVGMCPKCHANICDLCFHTCVVCLRSWCRSCGRMWFVCGNIPSHPHLNNTLMNVCKPCAQDVVPGHPHATTRFGLFLEGPKASSSK